MFQVGEESEHETIMNCVIQIGILVMVSVKGAYQI